MTGRLSRLDPGHLVAALLPLAGILPTLGDGVINTADGPLHVQRIYAMGVLLGEGILYPRWVSWFHLGYGYPIFNFYPPGVFYLGGLLVRFGVSATAAFTIVATLAWALGSAGMYRLARRFLPGHAAILAATLWAYAPSRLFEVWDQGSLPQMMAAALIPWLLAGVVMVACNPTRRGLLSIALPVAGILFCHQPVTFITALYVAPVALFVPLWAARKERNTFLWRFVHVAGGLLLGVGLAGIFLVPLALELRFVQAARGATDTVDYLISNFLQPNEVFAQPQPADLTDLRFELPTTLGLVGGVLAVPGMAALVRRRQYGLALALFAGLAFTLFMLLEASLPVWLGIPYLRQLRFPERFLRMGAVLVALAGGASVLLLPKRWQIAGLAAAMIGVVVATLPLVYPNQRFIRYDNLTATDEIQFELDNATWGTTSYDEFDPVWGASIPLNRAPEMERYADEPLRLVVNRVDMARYGDIMQVEQVDAAAVRVTLAQPHAVRFHQYFFPGWTATLDGSAADIYPDEQFGLITVDVPAGEHVIRLAYAGTPAQTAGAAVTLASVVIAMALVATGVRTGDLSGRPYAGDGLSSRLAWGIGAAAALFVLVNTLILTPNTLLFRHRSPPDAPYAMQIPVHASFGATFELLGYSLLQDSAAPGELFSVMLFWRAQRELDREYRPVAQLVNLSVTEAWAVSEPFFPGGGHTPGYPQDRFASEIHEMRVFDFAPPYVARIMVQMLDAETGEPLRLPDGSDRLLLEPLVRIRGGGQPVNDTLRVAFGDVAALRCADARRDGDTYRIRLFWRVLQPPAEDFTTFVHGLDATGNIVAQGDAPPLNGDYPPSLWLAEQYLADNYTLPYNPAIVQIAAGLYDAGGRLPVMQNGQPMPDNRVLIPLNGDSCLP